MREYKREKKEDTKRNKKKKYIGGGRDRNGAQTKRPERNKTSGDKTSGDIKAGDIMFVGQNVRRDKKSVGKQRP
jgi:hypothetical protein